MMCRLFFLMQTEQIEPLFCYRIKNILILNFNLMDNVIYSILIGLVVGFLGNFILKDSGNGLFSNLAFGIAGGVIGGLFPGLIYLDSGAIFWTIISATAGSIFVICFAAALNK